MYSFFKRKFWLGTNIRIQTQIFSMIKPQKKISPVFFSSFSQRNRFENLMSRNSIEVTCLNGESLGSLEDQDNPVLNRTSEIFPALPGLYMIYCLKNDWRYYGETSNLQARKSSHRSLLKRKIHPNKKLQEDYNSFGSDNFHYSILHMGEKWQFVEIRRKKELEYLCFNNEFSYNIYADSLQGEMNPFWGRLHTEEAKKSMLESRRGKPNALLGKKIFIPPIQKKNGLSVQGGEFPSIAEASKQTGFSRRLIRERLVSADFPDWKEIKENS